MACPPRHSTALESPAGERSVGLGGVQLSQGNITQGSGTAAVQQQHSSSTAAARQEQPSHRTAAAAAAARRSSTSSSTLLDVLFLTAVGHPHIDIPH
jgi:hypothetical protein